MSRDDWERMRLHAAMTVQPHCSKKIAPKSLLPLPWDEDHKKAAPQLSKEERRKRFEELMRDV